MYLPINAKVPASGMQDRLTSTYRQGLQYLAAEQWQEAENIFAEIGKTHPTFKIDGRSAKQMLYILKYEKRGYAALKNGDLKEALAYFHKTENVEKINNLESCILIEEYLTRAAEYEAEKRFRHAAWMYDQLLQKFPNSPTKAMWEAARSENWHRELYPIFDRGLEAFNKKNWQMAKETLGEVVCADPNFRRHGKMAAALLDQSKREIRQIANAAMAQGDLAAALEGYKEILDMHKVEQISELIELQNKGEAIARDYEKKQRWEAAVAVYDWLLTLDLGPIKHKEWEEKRNRLSKLAYLANLFNEGLSAQVDKDWKVAAEKFGEIKRIDPKFGWGNLRAAKLHRSAQMKMHLGSILP
jgi:tetratricopeptide (TPR) repeat protein